MNVIVKNKLLTKKIYTKLSSAIKSFGAVQQKLKELKDIKESNNIKSELESITCPLTGALNREGLNKLFDNIVPSALKKVTLICIEIDRINQIQNKLSKRSFDKMLKTFVDEVNNTCQNTDIICRWNANDFVLICPETPLEEATALALKIRNSIKNNQWKKGVTISCSTGVTQVYGTAIHEVITQTKQSILRINHKAENKSYVAQKKTFDIKKKTNSSRDIEDINCLPAGVLNRIELSEFLDGIAVPDLQRTCVIFIETCNFEDIYKQHGQIIASEILNSFAAEIKKIGRKWDTLAQWSSTEYILVCPSTSIYHARDVAKEIQLCIKSCVWKNNIKISCKTDVYDSNCIDVSDCSMSDTKLHQDTAA